ncbi:hypothetical protein JEZ13_07135 [bacterium]|nr:hypothetical protein [bacterium]
MPTKQLYESFSFRIHVFFKIILIIFLIMIINGDSLYLAGFVSLGLLALLLKGRIRNSWLKLVSKLAYFLIAYILLDLIFSHNIQSALFFVGKLLNYLILMVWLKESTNLESYLSDVYSLTFVLGVNFISRKVDSFFHYLNFYVIATIKLVGKFVETYDSLFPKRTSFINLFLQVFLNTLLRVPETKLETNQQLALINYRPLHWKANLPIIFLIILLGFLYWSNCEDICRNFFLK